MPGGKTSFCNSRKSRVITAVATKSQHGAGKNCSLKCIVHCVTQCFLQQIVVIIKFCKIQVEKGIQLQPIVILIKLLDILLGSHQSRHHSPRPMKKLVLKESEVEQVKSAEAPWMLKVAESDYSLTLCDNIGKLFMWMFPGNISSQYQLGLSNASSVVSDGLSPCLLDETA